MLSYQEYYNMRPSEFRDGDAITVKLALVLGYGNDFAIYAGTSDMSDEEVVRNGDKVDSWSADQELPKALFRSAVSGRFYRG